MSGDANVRILRVLYEIINQVFGAILTFENKATKLKINQKLIQLVDSDLKVDLFR